MKKKGASTLFAVWRSREDSWTRTFIKSCLRVAGLKCTQSWMSFLTSKKELGQRNGLIFRHPICPWKDTLYFPLLTSGKTNGDPDCEASAPMPTLSCLEEISQETKARMEEEAYNKGWVRLHPPWGHLVGLRRYLPTGLSCFLEDLRKQQVALGPPCLSKELHRKEQDCSTGRTGGSRVRGCG